MPYAASQSGGSPHSPFDLRLHSLAYATSLTTSSNGAITYVVCACGRRRVVWRDDWAVEQARREAAQKETP